MKRGMNIAISIGDPEDDDNKCDKVDIFGIVILGDLDDDDDDDSKGGCERVG